MSTDICTCPIRSGMTYDELMEEIVYPGKNCCDSRNAPNKGWMCSTLEKELRRADAERSRVKYYKKRLKKAGLTSEEAKNAKPPRKRLAHAFKAEAVDLDTVL